MLYISSECCILRRPSNVGSAPETGDPVSLAFEDGGECRASACDLQRFGRFGKAAEVAPILDISRQGHRLDGLALCAGDLPFLRPYGADLRTIALAAMLDDRSCRWCDEAGALPALRRAWCR